MSAPVRLYGLSDEGAEVEFLLPRGEIQLEAKLKFEIRPVRRNFPSAPEYAPQGPHRFGRIPVRLIGIGVGVATLMGVAVKPASHVAGTEKSRENYAVTATVERRDFVRVLRMHGLVEAVQFHSVAAPRLTGPGLNTLIITRLLPSGTIVKKGNLLVEFDRQNQIKIALDRKAEYRDLEEQIKKKQAEQAAALARDETELRLAESAVEVAKLDMLKNEVVSRIDAEKHQQNLEEAQAQFKQLRETFNLKRQAARSEIRILEIQRDRARNAMRYAEHNTEKMTIRSPLDGLVVLNSIWKGGQRGEVLEGDEVRPGVAFMQVVNPSAMQVRARVNQVDLPHLRIGQHAKTRLDAYAEVVLNATLEQLGAIGAAGSFSKKMRTFVATFSIQGADPKLTPDLSTSVEVELERIEKALVVPLNALQTENGKTFVLVKRGTGSHRQEVKIVARSDMEAVVETGVSAGDVVLRHAAPQN